MPRRQARKLIIFSLFLSLSCFSSLLASAAPPAGEQAKGDAIPPSKLNGGGQEQGLSSVRAKIQTIHYSHKEHKDNKELI